MTELPDSLRVALLAGGLTRGGAEKQLVYMARALRDAGVCVRVYTLGDGEFYEAALHDAELPPVWVGRAANPVLRLVAFVRALRRFRPHIVQAAHSYVNLYVAFAARVYGSLALGAVRGDAIHDVLANGGWGRWLLRMPHALLVNSFGARYNAESLGVERSSLYVVPNVIDASAFEARQRHLRGDAVAPGHAVAVAVANLVPSKRLDRFLEALARARRVAPGLRGVLVGQGPERASLEALAHCLGLLPGGLDFRGGCDDIPGLLAEADMLVLTSDHEGFPNVILEAMAAGLPVLTTPAGDAGIVVQDGGAGYVVPFEGGEALAERLVQLATSPDLRRRLGEAGREYARARYSSAGLAGRLLSVYRAVAQRSGRARVVGTLASHGVHSCSAIQPR